MSDPPDFEIVVGTYEEFLLGYTLSPVSKGIHFTQTFATRGHTSSVRCISNCGKYLVSGGADDRIIIYDMETRKELFMLTQHEATITSVAFTVNNTHVISGSDDGVLSIVRVGSWILEKIWKNAHRGCPVLDIAVHPSGKLALTLGGDHVLRTWNLIKGRQAYAINLTPKSKDAKSIDTVKWSPCGVKFVLGGGLNVEVWSVETGGILSQHEYKSRVSSLCWLKKNVLAVGLENGEITILNTKNNEQQTFKAHSMRVKCIQSRNNWIVSAASDGHIKAWLIANKSIAEKGDYSTGCRCTCLVLVKTLEMKKGDESEDIEDASEVLDDSDENTLRYGSENIQKYSKGGGYKVIIEEETSRTQKDKVLNKNIHVKSEKVVKKQLNKTPAEKSKNVTVGEKTNKSSAKKKTSTEKEYQSSEISPKKRKIVNENGNLKEKELTELQINKTGFKNKKINKTLQQSWTEETL